jgi:hypothetical protein
MQDHANNIFSSPIIKMAKSDEKLEYKPSIKQSKD